MSIIIKRGSSITVDFSSPDYPVLTTDWTGEVVIYASYPDVITKSVVLTKVSNSMRMYIDEEDTYVMAAGVYMLSVKFSNLVLGVNLDAVQPITVTDPQAVGGALTVISMTIVKVDGTPAGKAEQNLVSSEDGTALVQGWKGVTVSVHQATANDVDGLIVGTEIMSTTTNAAGYAELPILKGLSVVVSCPAFGKTISVDTTGLDTIDLSSYF